MLKLLKELKILKNLYYSYQLKKMNIFHDKLLPIKDITNEVENNLEFMSMHRVGKYKLIALLSTVLGIGTIGGAYYATGSTDALDTIIRNP